MTPRQLGLDQKDPSVLRLPDELEVIEDYQFKYRDMETLIIPRSVKKLGESAFAHCDKMREVIFEYDS